MAKKEHLIGDDSDEPENEPTETHDAVEEIRIRRRAQVVIEVRKAREERRELAPKARKSTRWTYADDQLLRSLWGEFALGVIAKRLKRTLYGVESRSRTLKLPKPSQGTLQIRTAAKLTGYDGRLLTRTAGKLGIVIGTVPCGAVKWKSSSKTVRERWLGNRTNIDEEDLERITTYLKLATNGSVYARKFVWGAGGLPATCVRCNRVKYAHRHLGQCVMCCCSALNRVKRGLGSPADQAIYDASRLSTRGNFIHERVDCVCLRCAQVFQMEIHRVKNATGVCTPCRNTSLYKREMRLKKAAL